MSCILNTYGNAMLFSNCSVVINLLLLFSRNYTYRTLSISLLISLYVSLSFYLSLYMSLTLLSSFDLLSPVTSGRDLCLIIRRHADTSSVDVVEKRTNVEL